MCFFHFMTTFMGAGESEKGLFVQTASRQVTGTCPSSAKVHLSEPGQGGRVAQVIAFLAGMPCHPAWKQTRGPGASTVPTLPPPPKDTHTHTHSEDAPSALPTLRTRGEEPGRCQLLTASYHSIQRSLRTRGGGDPLQVTQQVRPPV